MLDSADLRYPGQVLPPIVLKILLVTCCQVRTGLVAGSCWHALLAREFLTGTICAELAAEFQLSLFD